MFLEIWCENYLSDLYYHVEQIDLTASNCRMWVGQIVTCSTGWDIMFICSMVFR